MSQNNRIDEGPQYATYGDPLVNLRKSEPPLAEWTPQMLANKYGTDMAEYIVELRMWRRFWRAAYLERGRRGY